MEDLRVPTVALSAEILLADGQRLYGRVFRATLSQRHAGEPLPDEWINAATDFFPFLPDGGDGTVLLNKDQVVVARVDLNGVASEFANAVTRRAVAVRTLQCEVKGVVVIDRPAQNSRLLDHMNGTDRFLSVAEGTSCWLVHKRFITQIQETEGAE